MKPESDSGDQPVTTPAQPGKSPIARWKGINYYVNSKRWTITGLQLIVVFFSVLLYFDLKHAGAGTNPVIGTVKFSYRDIERKFEQSVVWGDMRAAAKVRNRDTIRTQAGAGAVLVLNDGTHIHLAEKSMILLDLTAEGFEINFAYGSVQANRSAADGGRLVIRSAGEAIELTRADVQVSKTGDRRLDVQVSQGEATIRRLGSARTVRPSELASVEGQNLTFMPLKLRPQTPHNGKYFMARQGAVDVDFRWEADVAVPVEVRIARDPAMRAIVRTIRATGTAAANLPGGTYYWRLSAYNPGAGKHEHGPVHLFTVVPDKAIQILAPSDNRSYRYAADRPLVPFRWTTTAQAGSYLVQIAADREFKRIAAQADATHSSIAIQAPGPGVYFARVLARPLVSGLEIKPSQTIRLQFTQQKIALPPLAIYPRNDATLTLETLERKGTVFAWHRQSHLKSFEIEFASDRAFSAITYRRRLERNFIAPEIRTRPGLLYWRVRGILHNGTPTEYSPARFVRMVESPGIALQSPRAGAALAMPEHHRIDFRWSRPDHATAIYVVDVAAHDSFKDAIGIRATGLSERIVLDRPGAYFWRVRALAPDGTEILRSRTASFRLLDFPKPRPLFPAAGETVNLSESGQLSLRWEATEGARAYRIEIEDKSKLAPVVLVGRKVRGRTFALPKGTRVENGAHRWRLAVQYATPGGALQWSPSVGTDFTVVASRAKVAAPRPTPQHPARGEQVSLDYGEALRFRWAGSESARSYVVSLYRKSASEQLVFRREVSGTTFSHGGAHLTAGDYFWSLAVRYSDAEGKVQVSEPAREAFRLIRPEFKPPVPVPVSPREGAIVDYSKRRQVHFRWQPDKRATLYRVEVLDRAGRVLMRRETEGPHLLWSAGRLRDGRYTWTLALEYENRDRRKATTEPVRNGFRVRNASLKPPKIIPRAKIYVE